MKHVSSILWVLLTVTNTSLLANPHPTSYQCITYIERYYEDFNGGNLHLDKCDIRDGDIPAIIDFSKTHPIKLLDLRFNNITAKGIAKLSKQMKLGNLRISYNPIGNEGAIALAKNETLEELSAVSTGITDQGVIELAKHLSSLSIGNDGIGSSGFLALGKSSQLTNLTLSGNLSHENVNALSRNKHIRVLGLGRVSFEDPNDIALLAIMSNLHELYTYGTNIGDMGAIALSKSTHYHNMIIDLVNAGISDIGVASLATMPYLYSLNLSNFNMGPLFPKNNIGIEGLSALRNSMIHTLYLKHNSIDDEGVAILAKNTSFQYLDLSYNAIGNKGAFSLAQNNTLNKLYLFDNPIDQVGKNALEANTSLKILGLDLSQAVQNSNDAMYVAQIADKGISELSELLLRMREFAVKAANWTSSPSDREAFEDEIRQLISEMDRVAINTSFNGRPILNGSFNALFQVGDYADETTLFSYTNFAPNAIGYLARATGTRVAAAAANDITISVAGNQSRVKIKSSEKFATTIIGQDSTSAYAKATAINAAQIYGLSATASTSGTQTVGKIGHGGATDTYNLSINGVNVFYNQSVTNGLSNEDLRDAINYLYSQTGVVASVEGTQIILSAEDGRNITIVEGGTHFVAGIDGLSITGGSFDSATSPLRGRISISATQSITLGGTVANDGLPAFIDKDGLGIDTIDVTTRESALLALERIDSALDSIIANNDDIGSMKNRFKAIINATDN